MEHSTVSLAPVLLTQATGQLLLAVLLASLLFAFQRVYRQRYLGHWALSWLALAAYMLIWVGANVNAATAEVPRLGVTTLALVPGYLQVAWLLLGALGLAQGRDVPRRTVRSALATAVLLAPLAVAVQVLTGELVSASGLRNGLAGVVYLAAAALLARRLTIGRGFAAFALALYAVDEILYVVLGYLPRGQRGQYLPQLMSFDLIATAVIGLALVTWLLEGERERLVRAADLASRRGRAQECVYRISVAARSVTDMAELLRSVHESLQEVLPARNFYVALLDRESATVSFPYFADERDETPAPLPLGRGLTAYVVRTGAPLLATPEVFEDLRRRGEVEPVLSDCVDWLGAPLVVLGETIGVAAIQTYDPAVRLGPEEKDLFAFVAQQLASAIEARRNADRLRHEQARLQLMVAQVPAVLWTTDEQLRFTTSVGLGLAALGLAPNQVVGMTLQEFLGAGDPSLLYYEGALQGRSSSYEYERAGRFFLVHVEPLRDAEGSIRGTVGMAVDLTPQRDAERARRESEARLRQVIDLVPHFIFAKDEEGRFLLANAAVASAYGTTPEQLIGRTDADFARSQEEAGRFRDADLEVMRSGRAKVVEEPITDSAGRVRRLHTTKIPFTFSGTGRPAVLGVSLDVTEHRAAEEALRRASKEESLTVLAGGVAHDFNNLLAAVLGHASLALKELPPGSARRHVEKAAAAVERAAALTRQMLAYSGRGHFVVEPTDLNAIVRDNLPLLRVALPKSVRLETRLAPGLPSVEADVGQMQQVLMNLVINAAEAIGSAPGAVTVATTVAEVGAGDATLWHAGGQPLAPGCYVCIEVSDDGPGMEPETKERIFEPFFSTKSTGRGLGLAAVLGVVKGHRGALAVRSRPGEGTSFELLFPPSPGVASPRRDTGPVAEEKATERLTLLLVDDEEIVREMVGEVLEAEGHRVLRAEDGSRAVELFREHGPEIDAVLLDLSMPGLTGEQTFACLREIDPAVRVVLSSGYDKDEATRRFGLDGPTGFIQKPYRPADLLAEIRRCLGRPAAPAGNASA